MRSWIYVPANLAANPPVVAAIHWCSGSANAMYSTGVFNNLAEQKGFIVVFPETANRYVTSPFSTAIASR